MVKNRITKKNNRKDKMLKKVENYVDKERETIFQNISNNKKNRKYKSTDDENIEVLLSRIKFIEKEKPKRKFKIVARIFLYLVYTIIILSFIYIFLKYILNDWHLKLLDNW